MPKGKELITSPCTVLLPAEIVSPLRFESGLASVEHDDGGPAKPGWVVPSIVTGSVICRQGRSQGDSLYPSAANTEGNRVRPGVRVRVENGLAETPSQSFAFVVTVNVEGRVRSSRVSTLSRVGTEQRAGARMAGQGWLACGPFHLERLLKVRGEERGAGQHAEKDFTCTRGGEQLKRKRSYEITQSSQMTRGPEIRPTVG